MVADKSLHFSVKVTEFTLFHAVTHQWWPNGAENKNTIFSGIFGFSHKKLQFFKETARKNTIFRQNVYFFLRKLLFFGQNVAKLGKICTFSAVFQ